MSESSDMADPVEELIPQAKTGDKKAIEGVLKKLDSELRQICQRYYVRGAEFDDLLQESRIAVINAITQYDANKGSFRQFCLGVCVRRAIFTVLNRYCNKCREEISINTNVNEEGESEYTLEDVFPEKQEVEKLVLSNCSFKQLWDVLRTILTPLESSTLALHLNGYSYQEIALYLGQSEKTVDNALIRARHKAAPLLKRYLYIH